MPTICYELANYYVILTNKVLNIHAYNLFYNKIK